MRTSKPISTISYNSEEHLRFKLNELIKARKISDYMYIQHTAEEDEKKDHIHLWVKPNTLLDTMDLQDHFIEIDPKNPLHPFRCIDFRASSVDDWILYSQHYGPYLASKGESREFAYSKEDFRFYDEDTFEDLYRHAFKGSDWAVRYQILEQLASNETDPASLILNGTVPLNLASNLNAFKYLQTKYGLDRGDREGHD